MNNDKILITDNMHPFLIEELEKNGFECKILSESSKEILVNIVSDYVGIVISSKMKLDKELNDHRKKLKFIARGGSGTENIDREYAATKGIICINSK